MRLSFILPAALWLLLALIPLWALAFAIPRRRAPAGLWLSLLIRTTLIAALVLALAGAQIVRDTGALTTVFLLDRSESIGAAARGRAEAFVRAAQRSSAADPGFTLDRGILVNVDPSLAGRDAAGVRRFYQTALSRLRAMPGVESASVGSIMAFGDFTESVSVQRAGAPLRPHSAPSARLAANGSNDHASAGPGGTTSVCPAKHRLGRPVPRRA